MEIKILILNFNQFLFFLLQNLNIFLIIMNFNAFLFKTKILKRHGFIYNITHEKKVLFRNITCR